MRIGYSARMSAGTPGGKSIVTKITTMSFLSPASTAARNSNALLTTIKNTVLTLAISGTDMQRRVKMSRQQFDDEKNYQAIMALARNMLGKGIITESEYTIIDTKMKEKYHPFLGSI